MEFVWNDKNVQHIAKHGISPHEAEYIVEHAKPPYPQMIGDSKRLVVGRLARGEYVQVIYVPSRKVLGAVYVTPSRPLTKEEKKRFRPRKK
jgi:uncharacterized DUF497 family protein